MVKKRNIRFSRHAKQRMKLYGISEGDVLDIVKYGRKEIADDGKIFFIHDRVERFRYPVKVITDQRDNMLVIVSAYPLKKRRKNESKL